LPFESVAATRLDAGLFVQATLLSVSQVFLRQRIAALLFLAALRQLGAAAIAALAGAIVRSSPRTCSARKRPGHAACWASARC